MGNVSFEKCFSTSNPNGENVIFSLQLILFIFLLKNNNLETDSDTCSEPRSQKGLDHYLDSLFDPVLSYGKGELEKPAAISRRMKGGGHVGEGNGAVVPQTSGQYELGYLRKEEEAVLTQLAYDKHQESVLGEAGKRLIDRSALPSGTAWRKTTFQNPESCSTSQAGGLIRHSKLNSEHNPEPTQNIRNIIKQYQQPLRVSEPTRSDLILHRLFLSFSPQKLYLEKKGIMLHPDNAKLSCLEAVYL
ncbi:hypothetical protein Chor_015411 [Crotalus horridus]